MQSYNENQSASNAFLNVSLLPKGIRQITKFMEL